MNEQMKMITLGLCLLLSHPLQAVLMIPLSIEDLTAQSQLVAHGKIMSKSCQRDAAGRIYTKVELQVTEVWKGTWAAQLLTVVHGGGILGEERVQVSGQVDYQIGEEAVVFAMFNQRGEAVTLGLAQGKFHVWKDQASARLLVRNPFHGHQDTSVSTQAQRGRGTPPALHQLDTTVGVTRPPSQTPAANTTASGELTLAELKHRVRGAQE